jgi:predicted NACHT family NTPase
MDRGLQASARGLEVVKQALKLKGWTQEYLSGMAGCSRPTLFRFLAGQRIEKRIAQDICNALDLTWGEIVTIDSDVLTDRSPNIDELVETFRTNIYDSIQIKCGSMRVLDMTHPIDLNAIYTNVNILEKITGRQRLEYQELIQNSSLENFDRFSLSRIQEAHIPALDAVDKYAKLMILGKPGAGKTTFLKYVALQCIEGQFKPDLIPLFITLKDFAEADKQPSLLDYTIQLLNSYDIEPDTKSKKESWNSLFDDSITPVEFLLKQGKFLILLDGLDEIKTSDSKRSLQQIQDFSNRFAKNIFAITCRIAAKEYMFEKFTEVEVTDFEDRQIATFSYQWFQSKNDLFKAENFINELQEKPGIRELASSPLLLTLLCLVFGESGSFPPNRSELYKEGLDVLLKKWDVTRNVERHQIYQKLSLKRKEDLLSQIALDTFEKGTYFFKQKEVERYITQYIRNLPNANIEEEALPLDSEAVLKSIEAQHSLLVERAKGIYSFSHLTFHEYFAARKIVTSANSDALVQKIVTYTTDKRWREVFLLTVGMLESADLFLEAMKEYIDSILSEDELLQNFLDWVEQKSYSTRSPHHLYAVRACYLNLDRAFAFHVSLPPERILDRELDRAITLAIAINPGLPLDRALDRELDRAITLARTVKPIKLHISLQQLKNQLPDTSSENHRDFYRWWKANGKAWTEQLRTISIEHRNIGHDWQFSKSQKILLQQYSDANKLLIECLNSDCCVSREVRELIESTLLLPIASIEKLKSRK